MNRKMILCASIALIVCLSIVPIRAKADVGYWWTAYPTSFEAYTFAIDYWALSIPEPWPVDAPGVQRLWDDDELNLRTSYSTRYVYSYNFTDETNWTDFWGTGYVVPWFPPADKEIIRVSIMAIFQNDTHTPDLWLSYSTDGGYNWDNSAMFAGDESDGTNNTIKQWDVTDLETWGNDTFLDDDFVIRMVANVHSSTNYYLDYLGLLVQFRMDGGAVAGDYFEEGANPTSFNPDYSFIFEGNGIIVVMGVIGLIGMIGIPAMTVWSYQRTGGSKLRAFVMAVAAMTLCLSLLLVSIHGS